MRFWEICSRHIFKLVAGRALRKIKANSIETSLAKSIQMIDPQTLAEMRSFVKNRQTAEGGFAGRGGNCDLYYTLFGCFVAEALGMTELQPALKDYVKKVSLSNTLKGVHQKCAVILYSKLFGPGSLPATLKKTEMIHAPYSAFINLLAGYYAEDFLGLYRIQRKLTTVDVHAGMPCSVTAAHLVLQTCMEKQTNELKEQLSAFYRNDGSYAAVKGAPAGDLLSTGVALYALSFADVDTRVIKPECLGYIDERYSEGGFCATAWDADPDVEYTFYGLLGLGALSN